jgi:hypothetical protein
VTIPRSGFESLVFLHRHRPQLPCAVCGPRLGDAQAILREALHPLGESGEFQLWQVEYGFLDFWQRGHPGAPWLKVVSLQMILSAPMRNAIDRGHFSINAEAKLNEVSAVRNGR